MVWKLKKAAPEQPVTETPAALVRRAADTIRTLAAAARIGDPPDSAWHVEECAESEDGDCACIVAQGHHCYPGGPQTAVSYVADAETPEYAAFIATMHLGTGEALALWLDICADYMEKWSEDSQLNSPFKTGGYMVACALLGEAPRL